MIPTFEKALSLLEGRLLTYHEVVHTLKEYQLNQHLSELLERADKQPAILTKPTMCCQRCNNQVLDRFEQLTADKHYCLNCLNMGRILQGEYLYSLRERISNAPQKSASELLTWQGQLSAEQARAANDLINSLADPQHPHSIIAVTGAGKTEMIFPVIAKVLAAGGRVAIASPRIDVCRELYPRLQTAFSYTDSCLLYGGTDTPYDSVPLIVSTTHQLLRFAEAFDLLIVDEVDAFPYAGDESLHFAVKRAVKAEGKLVYLTATPDKTLEKAMRKKEITSTTLPARYHGFPLPEPVYYWLGDWRKAIRKQQNNSKLARLLKEFSQIQGVKLIFMPNIYLAECLFAWLQTLLPQQSLACVHSKDPDRKIKVQAVREGTVELLISTTILERGVTFTNCHVCIVGAESKLFSRAALVQMSGRVGRKQDFPTGTLIYAHEGVSLAMASARKQIKLMNQQARARGLIK